MKIAACLGSLLMFVACDSGSGGGADGGASASAADSAQAVCQAACGRKQRCTGDAGASFSYDSCMTDCLASGPSTAVFKPGILSALASCYATLACGVSDDKCQEQVVLSQNANPEQDPAFQACLARAKECSNTAGVSFLDDDCVAYFLCTDKTVAAVNACLQKSCDTIRTCLAATLGK